MAEFTSFKDMQTSPPGSPAVGDVHLIQPTATGAWSGKDRQLARARTTSGGWLYYTPQVGERWFDEDTEHEWIWDGSNWVAILAPYDQMVYSPGALAANTEWDRYYDNSGSSSLHSGPTAADEEVRITRIESFLRGGASVGTYTLTPYLKTDGGTYSASSAFTIDNGQTLYQGMNGTLISPLITALGSDDHETDMAKGFKNEASSPGALDAGTQHMRFLGYICKVV